MRLFLIIFSLLVVSCDNLVEVDLEYQYGDLYFTMECVWRNYDDGETLWWCAEDVDTELLRGHLALELLEDGRLAFCGEQLELNTGHTLHDNLVSLLTQNYFNCFVSHDTKYGNEFDWIWYKEEKRLNIIWRPEDDTHKQLTLLIDQGAPVTNVEGKVYYKELN